jgi:hypothetical protein
VAPFTNVLAGAGCLLDEGLFIVIRSILFGGLFVGVKGAGGEEHVLAVLTPIPHTNESAGDLPESLV